jgi:hypothetical protein
MLRILTLIRKLYQNAPRVARSRATRAAHQTLALPPPSSPPRRRRSELPESCTKSKEASGGVSLQVSGRPGAARAASHEVARELVAGEVVRCVGRVRKRADDECGDPSPSEHPPLLEVRSKAGRRGSVAALAGSSTGGSGRARERIRWLIMVVCRMGSQRTGSEVRVAASEAWGLRPLHLPPPCSSPATAVGGGPWPPAVDGSARVAGCGWQSGRPGGLAPPPPSDGGEVHGIDDEFTAATSGSGKVVASARVVSAAVARHKVELGRSERAHAEAAKHATDVGGSCGQRTKVVAAAGRGWQPGRAWSLDSSPLPHFLLTPPSGSDPHWRRDRRIGKTA